MSIELTYTTKAFKRSLNGTIACAQNSKVAGILHRKDMTPPPYFTKAQNVSIFIEENSVFDCQILK